MITVRIEFLVGECNGTMGISISNHRISQSFTTRYDYVQSSQPNELLPGLHVRTFEVTEHTTISIKCFGKNPKKDTKLDNNGIIIGDKFIDIRSITVDGMKFERFHLYHPDLLGETYFYRDGRLDLKLPSEDNLLYWYLSIIEDHFTEKYKK